MQSFLSIAKVSQCEASCKDLSKPVRTCEKDETYGRLCVHGQETMSNRKGRP